MRAFAKRLRKSPPDDESILAALYWIERMVQAVRNGESIDELPSASNDNEPFTVNDDDWKTLVND